VQSELLALVDDRKSKMGEVDLNEVAANVMRAMAAQNDDAFNRRVETDAERDELAAWDSFAHAWIANVSPPSAEAAADFADALLARRRKTFGVVVNVGQCAPAPEPAP
jgi:hypothetical protein